jgi:hypothetical protein
MGGNSGGTLARERERGGEGLVVKMTHIKSGNNKDVITDWEWPQKLTPEIFTNHEIPCLFHSLFFQHVIPILSTVLCRTVVRYYIEYY